MALYIMTHKQKNLTSQSLLGVIDQNYLILVILSDGFPWVIVYIFSLTKKEWFRCRTRYSRCDNIDSAFHSITPLLNYRTLGDGYLWEDAHLVDRILHWIDGSFSWTGSVQLFLICQYRFILVIHNYLIHLLAVAHGIIRFFFLKFKTHPRRSFLVIISSGGGFHGRVYS